MYTSSDRNQVEEMAKSQLLKLFANINICKMRTNNDDNNGKGSIYVLRNVT